MLHLRKLCGRPSPVATTRFFTTAVATSSSASPDDPSADNYDNLCNAAGRSGDFAALHLLLNKRGTDRFFSTTRTFLFVNSTYSLNQLFQTLAKLDAGFTKKSAFDMLISRLSKLNRIDESSEAINVMIHEGCSPNAVTFYPILRKLTKGNKIDEAWRVIDMMRERGISPDVALYNYILTAHCATGGLPEAAGVLEKMEAEGFVADVHTYDALVLSACRAGKVDGALALMRRVEDDGLTPLYSTFAHVIKALLGQRYYAQAVGFMMGYVGRDEKLDGRWLGVLANKLIDLGRVGEAKFVLGEMRKMNFEMGRKLSNFCKFHLQN